MIVYDVSNKDSFHNAVENWLKALMEATKDAETKPVVMLCGNKTGQLRAFVTALTLI